MTERLRADIAEATTQVGDGRIAALLAPVQISSGDPTKTTVVFLHGIGSRATSILPVLERLPAGLPLLAWDAPGYGESTPLSSARPVPHDYAVALAKLLDARGLHTVDIVGHSLGCLMAGAFARAWPDRVRRLVLMSPALGYGIAPGAELSAGLARRISDFEALGAEGLAASRAKNLIHDPAAKPALVERVRAAMASGTMPGYGQAVRMLASGDLKVDAASLRAPVLVLTGAQDSVTPPAGTRGLYDILRARGGDVSRASPITSCVEVPDAGHAVYLEAPGTVAAAIAGFLDEPA